MPIVGPDLRFRNVMRGGEMYGVAGAQIKRGWRCTHKRDHSFQEISAHGDQGPNARVHVLGEGAGQFAALRSRKRTFALVAMENASNFAQCPGRSHQGIGVADDGSHGVGIPLVDVEFRDVGRIQVHDVLSVFFEKRSAVARDFGKFGPETGHVG